MTPRQAKIIMRKAFTRLTPTQRKRLREHAKANTPILCGTYAKVWFRVDNGHFSG